MSRVRRQNVPPALFQRLLDRVQSRKIPPSRLELLAGWLDGELIETFLLPTQVPKGHRVL